MLNKKYTKVNIIIDEDLRDCYEKWKNKEVSKFSWFVPVEDIVKKGYDLSARNPNRKEAYEHELPKKLLSEVIEGEKQVTKLLNEFNEILEKERK